MSTRTRLRIDWPSILEQAARILESYDTGVTLRQLFYRLVAAELLPNTTVAYHTLSSRTAAARRQGGFPALLDRTREIHRHIFFSNPGEARAYLAAIYRRDRTAGQQEAVYLGVEKHGIVAQLEAWFSDYGLRILALGGYSSQTYVDEIAQDAQEDGRPAVLVYAGDWDPSGEDITRDFLARCSVFSKAVRVALNAKQVAHYKLPEMPGKNTDTRAAGFIRRHGRLAQVELDALPPDTLRELFTVELAKHMDVSAFKAQVRRETRDRKALRSERR
jgi:hypothetical protein